MENITPDNIPTNSMSWVKALQHFFTNGKFGKKIEISEFKSLNGNDKNELREMLVNEGYNVEAISV